MNRIWTVILMAAVFFSFVMGRSPQAANALLGSGDEAVSLLMMMLSAMTLWSGLMEIMAASGDVKRIGKLFRKVGKPLFPDLTDDGCWEAISLNLSANLMGLGNAATPAGIESAKRLCGQGRCGMQALAMLLVLDNAGLQLLPTTVMTLRRAAGAYDPADVWGMTIVVSVISTVVGVLLMRLCQRGGAKG